MSVNFKTVYRKNPQDRTLPGKHYAQYANKEYVDLEDLAEIILEISSISDSDCLAVINELEKAIVRELKKGNIVRLGKIGNFQISFSSDGVDTEEEVTANLIKSPRVLFRPTTRMKDMLSNLKFHKVG